MEERVTRLMVQLLEWVSSQPRSYDDAMDAWRSSCPRHPVWDDALLAGLIEIRRDRVSGEQLVRLTQLGETMLKEKSVSHR